MDLSLTIQALLILASFATSALTSVLGMSGGLVLLAIMSSIFPVSILVPLHGIVIASNNGSRIFLMRRYVKWEFIPVWVMGMLLGTAVATLIFVQISDNSLKLILGFGLLFFNWLPKRWIAKLKLDSKIAWGSIATFGGFITMFIGAGATLGNAAIQHAIKNKFSYVATTAAMASLGNFPKIFAFIFIIEVNLLPYIYLLTGMLVAGFLGAKFGKKLLINIPENTFKIIIKTVITILAFRLLYLAWVG